MNNNDVKQEDFAKIEEKESQSLPSHIIYFREGLPTDPNEIKALRNKACDGDGDSQFQLAEYYAKGKNGVLKNIDCANYWYEQAAENGRVKVKESVFDKNKRFTLASIIVCGILMFFGAFVISWFIPNYICLDETLSITIFVFYFLFLVLALLFIALFIVLYLKNRQDLNMWTVLILAVMLIIGCVLPLGVSHPKIVDSYIEYEIKSDDTLAVWCVDYRKSVVEFPEEINGRIVTEIRSATDTDKPSIGIKNQLKKIIVPSTVKYVSIKGIDSLSVEIKDGTTSIPDNMFEGLSILESVTIPSSVKSIGNYAFARCSRLTSIDLPSGVTSISNGAFSGCSKLTSINIPSGVTSIGSWVFSDCSSLKNIDLPNSITSIGNYAFADCTSLTSIVLPSKVTSIGGRAFSGCSALTNVKIPSSVTIIEDKAFSECSALTRIEIPSSVNIIKWYAFAECNNLTIYCGAQSKPSDWDSAWNPDNRPVVWGYQI